METISAPVAGVIVSLKVAEGETVRTGQELAVLESMKIQTALTAPAAGVLAAWQVTAGETVQKGRALCRLDMQAEASPVQQDHTGDADNPALEALRERAAKGSDAQRREAIAKRHERGFRSARENRSTDTNLHPLRTNPQPPLAAGWPRAHGKRSAGPRARGKQGAAIKFSA